MFTFRMFTNTTEHAYYLYSNILRIISQISKHLHNIPTIPHQQPLSCQSVSQIAYCRTQNFLTIFLPQPGDELLWWNDSHFLLLSCNAVEKVSQACEQALFPSRLDLIGQHFLPEGPAKVQCLQHWVTVAGVAKLSDQIAIGERTDQRLMKDMWWHTCTYNMCHICN